MKHVCLIIALTAGVSLATGATAADKKGEEIYKTACAACHISGAAGAPKFADKTAWAKRIEAGLPSLIKSAIKGKKAMLPKGGRPNLTDMEVARAVVHMANAAGAKFKEPKPAEIAAALK